MKALYRKYRPKSLNEVIGQDQITTPLENSLKNNRIFHSYLFTGPRGTGKTSVARILAHEINNFSYELEDSYLDIIEIDAASNTGVDNIRDLREKAMVAPTKGQYKVYIIDEVHMLSKSAFNALLKIIEEPPKHIVFILATTDLEKVPITITSRSQVFTFRLAPLETMLPYLKKICKQEKIKIDDSALKLLISRGEGSFRDTLSLLDQASNLYNGKQPISEKQIASALGLPLDTKINDLLTAYSQQDFGSITTKLKELLNDGLKPESISESILKKIISSPSLEFLPLLEKLPSVSAPFPEAKLLLALLPTASNPTKKVASVSSSTATSKQPTSTNRQTKAQMSGQEQSQAIHSSPDKTSSTNNERPVSEQTTLNVDDFLSSLKLTNPAIAQQLLSCKLVPENNVLNIYPARKITRTILSRPQNLEVLKENLPENFEFMVHDVDDFKKDPKVAKISDIMGNVQEVNTNGGIPF